MRLVPETEECAAVRQASGNREGGGGGGAVVLVGVKLDSRSRELLTWALVKVASPGDRVVALHVIDPDADKSILLSLVKTLDSALAAYQGFCSLKQVDLRLKVRRGTPIRKTLSQEAELCGATSLVIGISEVYHTIRSRISVAKYCAKNLQKNVSILCVDNGKILFQRESIILSDTEFGSDAREFKRRKFLSRSLMGLPPLRVLSSCTSRSKDIIMDLVPIKTYEIPDYKFGWVKLRKLLLKGGRMSEISSTKKSSMPSQQSIVAIYLDQKQIRASYRNGFPCLDEEEGGVIQYSAVKNAYFYSTKIFWEEFEDFVEKYSTTCQLFSYRELLLATDNFSHNNLIGKGGHSGVYRGYQPGGGKIAVKILKPSEDVLKHFVSEIQLITSLHHKNIVSLVGFCFEEDQLLLVYDYVSRGCLEENLHGSPGTENFLCWPERYKVALGVAEALNCLHSAKEPIIHRDVKSSNILLADDSEPQLSDFGLATWASTCSYHVDTSDLEGTFGYLAPEYFMHGKLNEKIDVYAFGVVLLELLSGRKPIDYGNPKGQESLVIWVNHILKEGKISEVQDCRLVNACDNDQFERMVVAATLCIRHEPQLRPTISAVLKILQGDPEAVEWARHETETSENMHAISGEQSTTNIQSFINLALDNLEDDDDATSICSSEQNISVEDYLQGRWSRSSSFN